MDIKDNMSEFTDWLREELNKKGWRQADLVRATGISRSGISLLLNGQVRPAPQTIRQFANVFKVSPEIIMRKTGYLPKEKEGGDPVLEEANFKMSLLDIGKQRLVLDYMDFLIGRNERNGINTNGNDKPGQLE